MDRPSIKVITNYFKINGWVVGRVAGVDRLSLPKSGRKRGNPKGQGETRSSPFPVKLKKNSVSQSGTGGQ